ncbi:OmpA family protein [Flavicella marina]|uniref:OmpA family protein n=1 Tax=Flavicella marina TaxID=1475951 RepID=UPI00126542D5|nr:OmpA family protein [Flavicella marina]
MTKIFKRLILVVILLSSIFTFSQETESKSKFKEDYNTWAVGAGFSILNLHGDLRSFDTNSGDAYYNLGGYIYVDKMFNPILGVEGKINISQIGGEVQQLYNTSEPNEALYYRILYATPYLSEILKVEGTSFGLETSLVVNLDNLWKRHSDKWSWTSYFGVGYQKYNSRLIIKDYEFDPNNPKYPVDDVDPDGTIRDADFGHNGQRDFKTNAGSLYLNAAISVKYRLNDHFDIEGRGVLNLNNEDHLDAAISHKQVYESFFTGNIGIVYKFGKKEKYAIWVQDEVVKPFEIVDTDQDGVQDQLDDEANTPKNAEVYGNGVAIDSDKDGIKDYEDDCPLVPGPVENKGCPIVTPVVYEEPVVEEVAVEPVVEFNEDEKSEIIEKINLLSKSIYFKTASDQLKQESYKPLNEIADVMIEYPDSRFKIEGHTDSRGNDNYNLNLSQKRSKSVYNYLTGKNISSERLSSKGYGETKPIATNDTEAGRQQNRRVEINFIDPDSEEGKLVYPQGTVLRRSGNRPANYGSYGGGAGIDSDGDGVPDIYDREPNTPRESKVYGDGVSVDSDRDGVPDYKDDCPFAKGPVERNGCPFDNETANAQANANVGVAVVATKGPDADGDGVEDKFDKEPDTPPGVKVYANGVSFDSDKDGVPDHMDRCPLTFGEEDNNGCPFDEDLDGDGVVDRKDRCPGVKGDPSNFGCPSEKLTGDVETELKNLAAKMKFSRSEGHVLKSNNIAVLEKMGIILNQYQATAVKFEVHTSNKPNLKYNLDLSKRRAFAIKKYLTKVSGIDASRVEVEGLGGTRPKYEFEDKANSSKNNRVELYVK